MNNHKLYLPKITDKHRENFPELIDADGWTQTAVDFLSMLMEQNMNANKNEAVKPKLIILVGCAGSGKSTYAEYLVKTQQYEHLSSDKLRGLYGKDENDQTVNGVVFSQLKFKLSILLAEGKTVIVDATNLTIKDRSRYIQLAKEYKASVTAYVFEITRDELIKRCETRDKAIGKPIPIDVIDRMLRQFAFPVESEGIDTIIKNPQYPLTIDQVCGNVEGTFKQSIEDNSIAQKLEWTDRMKRIRAAKFGPEEEKDE